VSVPLLDLAFTSPFTLKCETLVCNIFSSFLKEMFHEERVDILTHPTTQYANSIFKFFCGMRGAYMYVVKVIYAKMFPTNTFCIAATCSIRTIIKVPNTDKFYTTAPFFLAL